MTRTELTAEELLKMCIDMPGEQWHRLVRVVGAERNRRLAIAEREFGDRIAKEVVGD